MSGIEVGSLMDSLGRRLADLDMDANRTRTRQAGSLRDLTAVGLQRRKQMQNAFASQGMTHSGANLQNQSQLGGQLDSQRARLNQQFEDRLTNIARQRIQSETDFNLNNLIPR